MQAGLDRGAIQHGRVLAAPHARKASQIGDAGTRPLVSIQPQQGALLRELVQSLGATDGPEGLAQVRPGAPVAAVATGAEPLVAVGLAEDGAGTDDFPALAPGGASSTHVIQPAKGTRPRCCLGPGALTGGLTRASESEAHPKSARSTHQIACLPLLRGRAAEQLVENQGAQGFDGLLGQRRQKARAGRAGWQPVTVTEGHAGNRNGPQPLVAGFQGAFTAEGGAEAPREQVDARVGPEAPPCKAHGRSRAASRQHLYSLKGALLVSRLTPYYLGRDKTLQSSGGFVPRSTRTSWQILCAHGRIAHQRRRERVPLERPGPRVYWQLDCKAASTVPPDPLGKRHPMVEPLHTHDVGTSRALNAQVREDFTAETALEAGAETRSHWGLPHLVGCDRAVRWVGAASGRDVPSPLVRMWPCVGGPVSLCPPHRPDKHGWVDRDNQRYT